MPFIRERIAAGARRSGRNPADITVSGYIRVSVDADHERARRAMAVQLSRYSSIPGYRKFLDSLGHQGVLDRLSSEPEAERFSGSDEHVLQAVSIAGTPDDVKARLTRFASVYDHPIVRVVPSGPGEGAIQTVIEACAP
jgi:alkanesulfonate monooxygenase SsuD/methylene tetrahydromethanopterin reductase-like flavin-dependent oxidoreductase (luciferase family)